MQNVLGIIFADSKHSDLHELTTIRPLGALPIAGRYRLIDFTLSNMVNSGMINVAVATTNNYHSLMGHLGSGKQWNLARKKYGLVLFPPFADVSSSDSSSRIDTLYGLLNFLKRSKQEYVLLSESYLVFNYSFKEMFDFHKANRNDITVLSKNTNDSAELKTFETYISEDKDGNISGVEFGTNLSHNTKKYFGVILINKDVLINIIERGRLHNEKSYLGCLINSNVNSLKMKTFDLVGYGRRITNLRDYYTTSMELLEKDNRTALFNPERPIYTKDKDTPPTKYLTNANVSNSLVADGCVIDGTVRNSIISRGVTIGKGAVVENCIVMQQGEISNDVVLKNVISDKSVYVKANRQVTGTDDFVVVIPKGKVI